MQLKFRKNSQNRELSGPKNKNKDFLGEIEKKSVKPVITDFRAIIK